MGTADRTVFSWRKLFSAAFLFGLFQAGMPLCGWFGGSLCGELIRSFGRFAAALLLCGIGVKMIADRKEEAPSDPGFARLLVLAVATSVDAFLTGTGFGFLGRTFPSVCASAAVIGITTLLISGCGGILGSRLGHKISAEKGVLAGGLVLFGLGLKTLFFG